MTSQNDRLDPIAQALPPTEPITLPMMRDAGLEPGDLAGGAPGAVAPR